MSEYRLEMLDISKEFPGVRALNRVTLRVRAGEVHALLGENGAGKSTLMKILSGAYSKDSGRILIDGEEVVITDPSKALHLGIVTIYQETNLAPEMTVAENILMNRWPTRGGGFVHDRKMFSAAQQVLDQLGTTFNARSLVKTLSPAQRQMTEIARAISIQAKIIILDEPTASLTEREVVTLMDVLRKLRSENVAIIYITHRLEEVFQIADRATVLRDGTLVATEPVSDLSIDRLVTHMVGRELGNIYTKRDVHLGKNVLEVDSFSGAGFRDINFTLKQGEILGMFGLVGSGRTEVARAIFGADRASGTMMLDGQPLHIRHPEDAIRAGIALAPEDRKTQGLVLDMPVRQNVTLQTLRKIAAWVFLRFAAERHLAEEFRRRLDIRTPSIETFARSLSGGNQQKVVLARCLVAQPKVLILDEPTRGIDIAGKAEVHKLVRDLAAQGVGILMISSELPEILGMCDRILVLHEGRVAGVVEQKDATEAVLVALASGQSVQGAVA